MPNLTEWVAAEHARIDVAYEGDPHGAHLKELIDRRRVAMEDDDEGLVGHIDLELAAFGHTVQAPAREAASRRAAAARAATPAPAPAGEPPAPAPPGAPGAPDAPAREGGPDPRRQAPRGRRATPREVT